MSDNGGSRFSYFLAGMGIGAFLALIFAPGSGSETRELIAKKAEEGRDFAKQRSGDFRKDAEEYLDKGKEILSKQKEELSAALQAGKGAYRKEKTKAN
jgi:gas vesicle protein